MQRRLFSSQSKKKIPYFPQLKKLIARSAQVFPVKPEPGSSKSVVLLTYLASFVLISMVGGLFLLIILFAYYSRYLPNPNRLLERSAELSTKLYDRHGTPIFEVYGEKHRVLISIDDIAPSVVSATLATEDALFYQHQGFSLRGMLRAFRNMLRGEGLQSGSTITQQAVKNSLLTQDRTVARKIKEVILSLQLENRYSKDEILQMYLNETPYGGQNYGIFTAAKAYFNKTPAELSVAEAAYLAGLPQRPSYYSYFGSTPEAGFERKNYVLYLMNTLGWIGPDSKRHFLSDEEYETAKEEELEFQRAAVSFEAPHFVFYVRQILADMFGEEIVEQGGLQVTTSLDLELQQKAQEVVAEELEGLAAYNVGNGALVALDPKTGQILAMVGSKGYFLDSEPVGCVSGITGENSCTFEPNLNVVLAARQPGSSIKPITYATMLSQGYTAALPFVDVKTTFPGPTPDKPYIPENYDGIFRGPMPLRKSLGNSLNIPAVKALSIVGVENMIKQAEKMGITTFEDRSRFGLALTLGGGETKLLEMTGAFAVFASGGVYRQPTPLVEVKDSHGKVLYSYRDRGEKALGEDVAFLISDILSDDGARAEVFGAGSLLNIPGHRVAVKTGTTDDKRDNYALGFTPSLTVGVWVGNNNNEAMNPYIASGITGATPIWRAFTIAALKDKVSEEFAPPKNVKKISVDTLTGMLPVDDFPSRPEWFIVGTEPTAKSNWYQKLEICKVDGLIANRACKDAGKTTVKTFVKILAEQPEWQGDVDKWVYEHYSGEDKYFPPATVSKLSFDGDEVKKMDPVVYIVGLEDGDTVSLEFRLSVEISASNDIDQVRIYKDGNLVATDESFPYGYNFSFDVKDAGREIELKVKAIDNKGRDGSKSVRVRIGG